MEGQNQAKVGKKKFLNRVLSYTLQFVKFNLYDRL